jgi:glycosyltransferase involved in cell wall biosynthesis
MVKPKIVCLCSTYGRLTKLSEAVSCFLDQDYDNKELLILNNHPSPLFCDFPNIKVYNEPIYPTLGDCRNRLIELANGDFARTFDDDDDFLPWTLSQGIENIKNFPAWKPKKSWFWCGNKEPELAENVFEAAMTVRIDVAKKYGYLSKSGGNEHETLLKGIDKEGGCHNDDMGLLASYIYNWGKGSWHISGSLGSGNIEDRTRIWKEHNNDVGDGIIRYINLNHYWKHFKESFDLYKKNQS